MVGERADCPAWAEHSLTRKREGAVHAGQSPAVPKDRLHRLRDHGSGLVLPAPT